MRRVIKNLKPEWVNMAFTLLGFLASTVFYLFVLFRKPAEVKPAFDEKQLTQIEHLFQNVLTKHKEEEKKLLEQIYEKERSIKAEKEKLNLLRRKIKTKLDQTWEQLPESQKAAYTEYVISQIEKQKK